MSDHELILRPHPDHGAGAYQLLLNGQDLSEVVQAGGLTLGWDNDRPVATITLSPDRIHLNGVTAEFVEALMAAPKETGSGG